MNNKLRVGVFMGGKSIEKEVSFNSGRTICDHLDTARYEVIPIFHSAIGSLFILPWRFLHRGKISDFEHRLETEAQKICWDDLKNVVDFIYIASHGRYAEDGTLQGFLEVLQIPYLGSKVLASALGMDKIIQKKILQSYNINVPKYITIESSELPTIKKNETIIFKRLKIQNINFPCIVKPHKEGSSLGISFVEKSENLLAAITNASTIQKGTIQSVLVEEFMQGMEFSCIIITDYKTGEYLPLPPTEIVLEKNTQFFDYEQKYMPGRALKYTPARCNSKILQKIQKTCLEVMQILEIENLARIDGFVTPDNKIFITDPNTLSGMSPSTFIFRQAAEMNLSHTQLINHLIETELARYNMLENIHDNNSYNIFCSDNNKKMKVAVFFGGKSHEKEISLESGRNIIYKLSPQKYIPVPIFVTDDLELYKIDQTLLVRNNTQEIKKDLKNNMKIKWNDLPRLSDFVFIALHGAEGENGSIQGALEILEIPYNGSSVLTSSLCINKYKTNQFLKSQGFQVPNHTLFNHKQYLKDKMQTIKSIEEKFSYPLIVKPHDDGCSILVFKAKDQNELISSLEEIFNDSKRYVLIEECIEGTELTVGVIGNSDIYVLPPSLVRTTKDILSIEEKFLPGYGENQTPAPLSKSTLENIKLTIKSAYKSVHCKGYARIDCFYQSAKENPTKSERIVILEINTLPGMTPATCIFHQAAEIGIKPMDFIDLIIQLGLQEHTQPKLTKNFIEKENSFEQFLKYFKTIPSLQS